MYMAPEQASGGAIGPATDVYALGAVAYHCLAGRPPFAAGTALEAALRQVLDDPDPLPDDVPSRARRVVARAMAKDPADRYPSAAALAAAARTRDDTVPIPVISRSPRRALIGAAVVVLAGLVAIGVALWPSTPGTTPPAPAGPAASAALTPRPAQSVPTARPASPRRSSPTRAPATARPRSPAAPTPSPQPPAPSFPVVTISPP
jgi:serine/threonine-protein kinase